MAWVALVGPEVEENLGLRYLASSLERVGVASEILPFNHERQLVDVCAWLLRAPEPPLVVAISLAFQWRAQDSLALMVALREGGYAGHITAGGHFGTFRWAELLQDYPELDSLCRHEAEETLVELVQALQAGRSLRDIPGLALRNEAGEPYATPFRRPPELSTLPWPDRRGPGGVCLGHPLAAMVASRGCYARCAFCCIAAWHEQVLPGKRYRLRPVEDVADEMAMLQRTKGVEIFIFHDDNFFLPDREASLERVLALGAALRARGVERLATVVKARPTDVSEPVFRAMQLELGLVRLFLGIESDSDQGLKTLERRVKRSQNQAAMTLLRQLGVYVCFNLLIFDPDTTLESLEDNLAFMEAWADCPHNFGRVELYAGTPLLARLEAEDRCWGDYLGHDYHMATPPVQRVFELTMRAFFQRNFSESSLANRLMGTRFDVEVARHFHPDRYDPRWLEEARDLNRRLTQDSVLGLRTLMAWVKEGRGPAEEVQRARALSQQLRQAERGLAQEALELEQKVRGVLGVGGGPTR